MEQDLVKGADGLIGALWWMDLVTLTQQDLKTGLLCSIKFTG
jgi:hypothetical protein